MSRAIHFISQYYPPESNAPANRVASLARHWSEAGARVTVLTGYPNHPEGVLYPGEEVAGLADWGVRVERDGAVEVLRLPIYLAANKGVLKRSLAFASFLASASMLGLGQTSRPDCVVATSPQLLAGVAGAVHRLVRRRPFVLEIRDLWPDSIVAVGAMRERHPLIQGLRLVERRLYRRADHIVVVSPAFRELLVARGVSRRRITVIPNGVDAGLFDPTPQPGDPFGTGDPWPGRFVVCFAGTIGMAHGLVTVLDAAEQLARRCPEVLFVLAGEGAEREALEVSARERGLSNVLFIGRLPRAQIPGLLRRADLSLVTLRDSPLFRTVLPSKIFESMGCARPIALAVDGEARKLVERAGAGCFVPPGSSAALVERIVALRDDPRALEQMGRSGRAFVMAHYERSALARQYLELLGSL